jgi:hypothetical protein
MDAQRDRRHVQFARATFGDSLWILFGLTGFASGDSVALGAVSAGDQDRAPSGRAIGGKRASSLARFVVGVGMHHHQHRLARRRVHTRGADTVSRIVRLHI